MICSNGNKYDGIWKNGIINEGKITDHNGLITNIPEKPQSIKSVKIKSQGFYGTRAFHSCARNFVRTFQILNIFDNNYVEQFYLIFFIILVKFNNNCNGADILNNCVYLLNYLKYNYQDEIYKFKYSDIECLDPTENFPIQLLNSDATILNISLEKKMK